MPTFTERQEYDFRILSPYSIIQCEIINIIEKDGVEVARTQQQSFVRRPGDDISEDCEQLQSIAELLWTEEVIQKYIESTMA